MTAIVTDVHYRMSLAIIRDLADNGIRTVVCEYDEFHCPVGFYSSKISAHYTLNSGNKSDALLKLCGKIYRESGEKPVLFPVGAKTLELVSINSKKFAEVSYFLIPSPYQLDLFNDKSRVAAIAKDMDIAIPREYKLSDSFSFPVVVKPTCGEKAGLSAADRYVIAENSEELEQAYSRFENITEDLPVIQEYLTGGGAGCSVLCRDGEILAHICHRRVREYPVSGGPSSCCEKIMSPSLLTSVRKVVSETKYSGIAMFEFKKDSNGEYRLLEVNPRVWGTYPLTRACGSNFTYLWFLAAAGADLPEYSGGTHVKMAYYPSDLAAALCYLKHGKLRKFLSAISDFADPRVKNGLSERGDRRPYRMYLKSLFKR